MMAGDFEELKKVITDLDVFSRMNASEDGKFDLIRSWQKVSSNSLSVQIAAKGGRGTEFDAPNVMFPCNELGDPLKNQCNAVFNAEKIYVVYNGTPSECI